MSNTALITATELDKCVRDLDRMLINLAHAVSENGVPGIGRVQNALWDWRDEAREAHWGEDA